MPIIVRARGNENTNDVIKKFKKAASATDVVQKAKDRAYFQKPSKLRAANKIAKNRMRRRLRSMKRMKNVTQETIQRIVSML